MNRLKLIKNNPGEKIVRWYHFLLHRSKVVSVKHFEHSFLNVRWILFRIVAVFYNITPNDTKMQLCQNTFPVVYYSPYGTIPKRRTLS